MFDRICVLNLCYLIAFTGQPTLDEDPENDRYNSRIVNGEYVDIGRIPYQVAVVIDVTFLCGGSLISHNAVLTAAHCTYVLL